MFKQIDWQDMVAFVSLVAREYEDEMAQWRMALQARNALITDQ
jgi:hypothetical protein